MAKITIELEKSPNPKYTVCYYRLRSVTIDTPDVVSEQRLHAIGEYIEAMLEDEYNFKEWNME